MALQFTLDHLPQAGDIKDACALPFACIVRPFTNLANKATNGSPTASIQNLGRCRECYAYINHYCHFSVYGWSCALCGGFNDYRGVKNRRYAHAVGRAAAAELHEEGVEVLCNEGNRDGAIGNSDVMAGQPIYLALVDVTCSLDFLELVKSGLLAALEALVPNALFGLVTFSSKVGLYDLQGQLPCVKYVQLRHETQGPPTPVALEEAMPLQQLLAPVAGYKEQIAAAVDALQPDEVTSQGNTAADPLGPRSFGGALQAVLGYVGQAAGGEEDRQQSGLGASTSGRGTSDNSGSAGATVLAFLAGPPDRGRGCVLKRKALKASLISPAMTEISYTSLALGMQPSPLLPTHSDGTRANGGSTPPTQVEAEPAARAFYEEAAAAAAALGICVDLYAASEEGVGLTFLEPLGSITGGATYLYPALDEATLPQDLYRRLSGGCALRGLLRMRTSPEFKVSRAYGRLFQDDKYDNLVHITSCTPHSTFAFDFQHSNAGGFATTADAPPMVQMVFQYSLLVPDDTNSQPQDTTGATQQSQAASTTRFVMQRRMRIVTKAMPVAASPAVLYQHAQADCILCLLMHKVSQAAKEEGLEPARQLLQDWLVRALARYNLNRQVSQGADLQAAVPVDATFEDAEALQAIPRAVYALLRSPMLSHRSEAHPDLRTSLSLLWASLPPQDLWTAIYPHLSSWQDPETQENYQNKPKALHPDWIIWNQRPCSFMIWPLLCPRKAYTRHSLSRAALLTAGAPIFLMDTYTSLILYYTTGYPSSTPFPPPTASKLRRAMQAIRQSRQIMPQLKMLRGGIDDVSAFTSRLIEEPDSMFSQGNRQAKVGLVAFLEQVKFEVRQFIEHGM